MMAQFRESVTAIDSELTASDDVADAIEAAERCACRMNLVVHTLSAPEPAESGDALIVRNSMAPLQTALTCTQGAMKYMSGRSDAQMMHLIPAQEIGAIEVEKEALRRLRDAWSSYRANPIALSALYLEQSIPYAAARPRTDRILEQFTDRLLEEDSWTHRVMVEQEIGDLVMRIWLDQYHSGTPPVRSYRAAPGADDRLLVSLAA